MKGCLRAVVKCLVSSYVVSMPMLAMASTDNATLKVGRNTLANACLGTALELSGYNGGSSPYGSYSPTGLTGGETVLDVFDANCFPLYTSNVYIKGFSVDPGQLWLTSVTCNGVTVSASSAYSFSYSSGEAEWIWKTQFGLTSLPVGTEVSCSITHK